MQKRSNTQGIIPTFKTTKVRQENALHKQDFYSLELKSIAR